MLTAPIPAHSTHTTLKAPMPAPAPWHCRVPSPRACCHPWAQHHGTQRTSWPRHCCHVPMGVTASAPHSVPIKRWLSGCPWAGSPPLGPPAGGTHWLEGVTSWGGLSAPRPLEQRARDSGWAGAAAGGDAGTRWGEQRSPGHRDKGTIKLTQPRCPAAGIFHLGPRGNQGVRVAPIPTGDPGGSWGSQGCQPWQGRG